MSEEIFTLKNTAIATHEFFLNLVEAGFTQEQALELTKAMMIAAGKR